MTIELCVILDCYTIKFIELAEILYGMHLIMFHAHFKFQYVLSEVLR
jgi:hypothetical protein